MVSGILPNFAPEVRDSPDNNVLNFTIMGQRTQVLIVERNHENKVIDLKGYHLQWGFGTSMMRFVSNLIQNQHAIGDRIAFPKKGSRKITFLSNFSNENTKNVAYDLEKEFDKGEKKELKEALQGETFNLDTVCPMFFNKQDNNNGGMVVEIKWTSDRAYNGFDTRIAFLKGWEDCEDGEEAFSKFLSSDEYGMIFPDYYKRFKPLWDAFKPYWGVTEYTEGEKPVESK